MEENPFAVARNIRRVSNIVGYSVNSDSFGNAFVAVCIALGRCRGRVEITLLSLDTIGEEEEEEKEEKRGTAEFPPTKQ